MNGDGGVMIDPVVQSEYRRKQKYLRDIIDGTGGTDTEQQPQLILDNNNNDNNNNNNNNNNPTDGVVLHNMHPTLLPPNSIYTLALPTLNTHDKFLSLSSLAGKIAVVINVACAWGKTALTYEQIQLLVRAAAADTDADADADADAAIKTNNNNLDDAADQEVDDDPTNNHSGNHNDIVILAFPTNDFRQEPGSNDEISQTVLDLVGEDVFHSPNFILFPKSSLETNPVYRLLQRHMPQTRVKHNFYKYIIGRDGVPIQFYTKKDDLMSVVTQFTKEHAFMEGMKDNVGGKYKLTTH